MKLPSIKLFTLWLLHIPVMANAMHFSVFEGKFYCQEIRNSFQCARHIETHSVLSDHRIIRTTKQTLSVTLNNGNFRVFQDKRGNINASENIRFSAIELFNTMGYVLIHKQFTEGHAYLLVNLNDGTESALAGYARLSPDKRHIVVAEKDLEAEYNKNILQVYSISPYTLHLIFDAKPDEENWGPSDVKWRTASEIIFDRATLNHKNMPFDEEKMFIKTPYLLKIHANGHASMQGEATLNYNLQQP